jgi:nickel transport protein
MAALAVAAALAAAGPAAAHKVNVFAYAEGGELLGQGYFPGGDPCRGCRVELLGPAGEVLAQTETDRRGDFRLARPRPGQGAPLTLRLHASMGHAAEYRLGAEELGLEQQGAGGPAAQEGAEPGDQPAAPGGGGAGEGQALRREVRAAVEEALAPVRRRLAEMEAQPVTVREVVGGLGYIVGLLGVALYLKSRRGV